MLVFTRLDRSGTVPTEVESRSEVETGSEPSPTAKLESTRFDRSGKVTAEMES